MDKKIEFPNTTRMSLSEATKPLLLASRLVGMSPKYNWHKIYTVFIIVYEISVISSVWQYYIGTDLESYYVNVLVHVLEDMSRITSLLVILGTSLFDKKRYMVPIKDLTSVDGSLKSLSECIDNRGTYRFQILLVTYIGMMVLLFGMAKLSLYTILETDDRHYRIVLSNWSYLFVVQIVCAVADCSFSSTLSIIRRRFKAINLIIHRAQKHGSYVRVNFLDVARARTDNYVLRHLRILRKQYHNLWRIANRVNEAYGLHLLMGATTSLALITSHLWISYSVFMGSNGLKSRIIIDCIICALSSVARMFLLVESTESTVAEAKAVSVMLQELEMNRGHDPATKDEIRDFLTQLQFEVLKFTACDFFNVDFTLICGILGAACTYLVILIQMSDSNACVLTDHFNKSMHFAQGNQ